MFRPKITKRRRTNRASHPHCVGWDEQPDGRGCQKTMHFPFGGYTCHIRYAPGPGIATADPLLRLVRATYRLFPGFGFILLSPMPPE